MTDVASILDSPPPPIAPCLILRDESSWGVNITAQIIDQLPDDQPWNLAIRQATDETFEHEGNFISNLTRFSGAISPLSVFRGAKGWLLYCGTDTSPHNLGAIWDKADEFKLTPLAVIQTPPGASSSSILKELEPLSQKGLLFLIDGSSVQQQNIEEAVAVALGAQLGAAWMRIPETDGNITEIFDIESSCGLYTIGLGVDRPDLNFFSALWAKQTQKLLAEAMLEKAPGPKKPKIESPGWPESFSELLEPAQFSTITGRDENSTSLPELSLKWPDPLGGKVTVQYHGRPVLKPTEEGGSVTAWMSKVLGLRELESLLTGFGNDSANDFIEISADITQKNILGNLKKEIKPPEKPTGFFSHLKQHTEGWKRYATAGTKGVALERPPNKTLPYFTRRLEQQVMRQPSAIAIAVRASLLFLAGIWLPIGSVLWRSAPLTKSLWALIAFIASLTSMAIISIGWWWYANRRTFWTYEQAIDNIETRFLHKTMHSALDKLTGVAQCVLAEISKLSSNLDAARKQFCEEMEQASDTKMPENLNRRFPEDKAGPLPPTEVANLTNRAFSSFFNKHTNDVWGTTKGEDESLFSKLGDCTLDTAKTYAAALDYEYFAQASQLTAGQRNQILRDIKTQSAIGLWPRTREMNPDPWLLVSTSWDDLAELKKATGTRVLTRQLPLVAALCLIKLEPETDLEGGLS